jgi:hypothetical protein
VVFQIPKAHAATTDQCTLILSLGGMPAPKMLEGIIVNAEAFAASLMNFRLPWSLDSVVFFMTISDWCNEELMTLKSLPEFTEFCSVLIDFRSFYWYE